jgi:hypothetical protein
MTKHPKKRMWLIASEFLGSFGKTLRGAHCETWRRGPLELTRAPSRLSVTEVHLQFLTGSPFFCV